MRSLIGSIANSTPVSYVSTRRGGILTGQVGVRNDATTQMRAFSSVGTLFQIVSRIASAVAQVEWKLYKKAASGRKEDRIEVTSHPALEVWNRPNDFYTRQEFVETVEQHVNLTGEGWWVIGRHPLIPSIPFELWPVRPDRMVPVPHPTEFLSGYLYRSPDGDDIPLPLDDVIQLRMPNPLDPYRGMGPVQALLSDIDTAKYSAEWNRNFFLNSAEPGGIIEMDRRLDDGEFDELSRRWREQHQGVAQAHRVAILEQGKWVDRKFSMRDMQFAELRGVGSEVIREGFGYPKPMLGSVDNVNRANAEAGEYMFARWIVVNSLERWKGGLNADLLGRFGRTARGRPHSQVYEFDYESPVPEDSQQENDARLSKAQAASLYITAGFTGKSVVTALDLPETLEWDKPAPPVPPTPPPTDPNAPPPSAPPADPNTPPADPNAPANLARRAADAVKPLFHAWHQLAEHPDECGLCEHDARIHNVKRWEAVEHVDDATCQPCQDNNGKLYTTRAEAYADYPGGTGYKDCVAADYGNCRGKVVRRGKKGGGGD